MTKTAQAKETPEERLARYWRKKSDPDGPSDFDSVLGMATNPTRSAARECRTMRTIRFDTLLQEVAKYVMAGLPLSKAEYHIALAAGFLMGEKPYEEFFKQNWHETKTHRAYGPVSTCESCKADKRASKSGGKDGEEAESA